MFTWEIKQYYRMKNKDRSRTEPKKNRNTQRELKKKGNNEQACWLARFGLWCFVNGLSLCIITTLFVAFGPSTTIHIFLAPS